MKKITKTWLKKKGACEEGLDWFNRLWPKGTDLNDVDVAKLMRTVSLYNTHSYYVVSYVRFLDATIDLDGHRERLRNYRSNYVGQLTYVVSAISAIRTRMKSI